MRLVREFGELNHHIKCLCTVWHLKTGGCVANMLRPGP
jgi:hypothetical protein